MKRVLFAILLTTMIVYSASNFKGQSWTVLDEGITLSFVSDDSISITSEEDETVGGKGSYTSSDSTISAKVDNEGTVMSLSYWYNKVSSDTIKAVTREILMNGDTMEVSDDTLIMVLDKKIKNKEEK